MLNRLFLSSLRIVNIMHRTYIQKHTYIHIHRDIFSWYYTPKFRKYISAAYFKLTLRNNFFFVERPINIIKKKKKEKIEYLDIKKRF